MKAIEKEKKDKQYSFAWFELIAVKGLFVPLNHMSFCYISLYL